MPTNPTKGTRMHFGHAQYLPIALPLFALLAGALTVLLILVQIRVLRHAYMQLGVSSGAAFFLLFASLFGSYINISIAALDQENHGDRARGDLFRDTLPTRPASSSP
jgi:uncharacterized membrane protein